MKRNDFFSQLTPQYLFSEVQERVRQFQEKNPEARLISLGIGDTTEPLGPSIAKAIAGAATDLQDPSFYTGYGPEQGLPELRERISSVIYRGTLSSDEIFISDGTKSDIARLLVLFGQQGHIAIQDPSYPAYADAARLNRRSDASTFSYVQNLPEDMSSLERIPDGALIILCSPNNPTGEVFTHDDLRVLVRHARQHHQLIVFDTAYRTFIQGDLPRSIYEVDGADKVAIETGSFSKMAGFSGIRLGWTVVPHALQYDDGRSIHEDFERLIATLFNGASTLSQKGGIQALSPLGQQECERHVAVYRKNTLLLQQALVAKSYPVWGGHHAPYLWVKTHHANSWEAFEHFLQAAEVIVTPGIGFGPRGEGYVRISGFGKPSAISEAASRISAM